ncbi:hypothetical protein PVK06_032333 [Gossypium arboreum]|uniref:Uncharacterized protein n=1 Tax=Gossypium arboreum TaxID=29729 RepID=A0ABR0NUK4_GOSAR|nr:hypothetical protein PVK06_032333 [Gossypium arboreum]
MAYCFWSPSSVGSFGNNVTCYLVFANENCNADNRIWVTTMKSSSPNSNRPRRAMMGIRWVPPEDDWVKINSDGAVKGVEQRAFANGVILDKHGNWIKGYCRNIGIWS